ncbi:MAG: hypothetical protein E6K59_05025 [Nitrospirae bacterium]|nr:MAG: hypothetical protein E6K59_05025 [Nitrospirota bacterium]
MPSSPHLLTALHSEDWHTPKGRFIREVMFGVNDGVVSTIGFVAGATGALMQTRVVLLAGVAAVVAGALAMGAGAQRDPRHPLQAGVSEGRSRDDREPRHVGQGPVGAVHDAGRAGHLGGVLR